MLSEIGSVDRIPEFVNKAKDKNDPFRLMGFGHRVYKNFDPRATIIKKQCDIVLEKLGVDDPLLNIAKELEAAALEDEYFKERSLYPNVDFYSGVIYHLHGIPQDLFVPIFAVGRVPGWTLQVLQQQESNILIRPLLKYNGPDQKGYVPLTER